MKRSQATRGRLPTIWASPTSVTTARFWAATTTTIINHLVSVSSYRSLPCTNVRRQCLPIPHIFFRRTLQDKPYQMSRSTHQVSHRCTQLSHPPRLSIFTQASPQTSAPVANNSAAWDRAAAIAAAAPISVDLPSLDISQKLLGHLSFIIPLPPALPALQTQFLSRTISALLTPSALQMQLPAHTVQAVRPLSPRTHAQACTRPGSTLLLPLLVPLFLSDSASARPSGRMLPKNTTPMRHPRKRRGRRSSASALKASNGGAKLCVRPLAASKISCLWLRRSRNERLATRR